MRRGRSILNRGIMAHLYSNRRDPAHMERQALAAYNRHKQAHGVPREMRSVIHQQRPLRDVKPDQFRGPAQMLSGKTNYFTKPEFNIEASAEYARPKRVIHAWKAPAAPGKTLQGMTHDREEWALENPPEQVAFGSSMPSRTTATTKARDLRRWRERVEREQRNMAPPGVLTQQDLDELTHLALSAERVPTASTYDIAHGKGDSYMPHCNKCGQDRFYCPHKAQR